MNEKDTGLLVMEEYDDDPRNEIKYTDEALNDYITKASKNTKSLKSEEKLILELRKNLTNADTPESGRKEKDSLSVD